MMDKWDRLEEEYDDFMANEFDPEECRGGSFSGPDRKADDTPDSIYWGKKKITDDTPF